MFICFGGKGSACFLCLSWCCVLCPPWSSSVSVTCVPLALQLCPVHCSLTPWIWDVTSATLVEGEISSLCKYCVWWWALFVTEIKTLVRSSYRIWMNIAKWPAVICSSPSEFFHQSYRSRQLERQSFCQMCFWTIFFPGLKCYYSNEAYICNLSMHSLRIMKQWKC